MKRDKEREEYSSGAEKVENISRGDAGGVFEDSARGSEMQGAAAGGKKPAVSEHEKMQKMRVERENQRAERRLEAAKMKAERKEAREKAKHDAQEERRIRAEERKARREMIENETAQQREKRLAKEKAAKERAAEKEREEKRLAALDKKMRREEARKARRDRKEEKKQQDRAPGFGGWLAAVISLGVAVLALGAIVTVGYFDLTEAKAGLYNSYQSSLYELSELVENMDTNLSKARVASGNYEMQKVLTDILVESELAESCLESFPVEAHRTENLTAFVNRVADYSRRLLNKLAMGGELSEEEEAVIQYMYETTDKIKYELAEVIAGGKEKNIDDVLKEGGLADRMDNLENNTIETPKMIYDGPFASSAQGGECKALKGLAKMSEAEILDKAREVFADYGVKEVNSAGRTESKNIPAYGVEVRTETGERYFAQFTEQGGKLILLDGYKECKDRNFDANACIGIAEKFLGGLGYEGLEPVWVSEAGVQCDINFAYVQSGVVCYNDLVKVKVCEERGAVTGLEARSYLMNHTQRDIPAPAVSKTKIERAAASRMELTGVRLALIPVEGQETLAYEINGTHEGCEYFAYLDAKTGRMVELFTVVDSAMGRALM